MNQTIGVIGLGNMGSKMSAHLAGKEYEVLGFDPLVKGGIKGVKHVELPNLVEKAQVILLSLPNSKIIEKVMLADDGVLSLCQSGKTIIDMSSADPQSTRTIEEAAKKKGLAYLDAAVSGGTGKAANGTLTIMVGGEREVFEKNRSVLEQLGTSIYYMGPSGSGDAMKAINNFLTATTLAATGEAMIVAKRAGLDLRQVLEVLNQSSGRSYATEYRFPKIIQGDYIEGGLSCNLMIKDVDVFRGCAQSLHVPALLGDFVASVFRLAVGAGKGDLVSNKIVDVLGDLGGGVRLSGE